MSKKSILLFLVLPFLFQPAIFSQENSRVVKGKVFLDKNENGIYDDNETGLGGIMVSNQRDVVITNRKGNYNITVEPGQALMVIKPSGYQVPVNKNQMPQFSFIYEPEGSPKGLKYGGLEPVTDFPDQIDFALTKAGNEHTFNALAFGDPQPRDHKELGYVRDEFVNQAANEDASFMIILGDIMYDDLSLFDRHKELLAKANMPVWHVIGNHDIDFDADGNRHARDTYKNELGANYYAFQYGSVTFIALDNVDYLGIGTNGRPSYRGMIWGDQLTWLKNLLPNIPENHLIVIGTHIPLYAWGGEMPNVNTLNRNDLFKLLEKKERVLAISGHLHMTYHHFLTQEEGWNGKNSLHHITTTAVSGTWWGGPVNENNIPTTTQRDGVPNGYHRFSFEGSDYSEKLIGLGEPETMQVRIELVQDVISLSDLPKEIVANVFNGSEKSKVWYRLNEGQWKEMKQVSRSSPFYEYLLKQYPDNWSSNLNAIPTNHLWVSDFSSDLEIGVHSLEVKTQDAYGQEWSVTKVIEVE